MYGLFAEVNSGYEFAKVTSGCGMRRLEFSLANEYEIILAYFFLEKKDFTAMHRILIIGLYANSGLLCQSNEEIMYDNT